MNKRFDGMVKYLTNLLNDNAYFESAVAAHQVKHVSVFDKNKHQAVVNHKLGKHRKYVYSVSIDSSVYNDYFFSQINVLDTFADYLVKNDVEASFSFLRTKLNLPLPKLVVVYYPAENLTFLLPMMEISSAPALVRQSEEIKILSVKQFRNLLKFATLDFKCGFYTGNICISDQLLTLKNYSNDILSLSLSSYGSRSALRELLLPLEELSETFMNSNLHFEADKTELGYCLKNFNDFKLSYYSRHRAFWHSELGQKIVHFDLVRFKYLNRTKIDMYDFWCLLFAYISPRLKVALSNLRDFCRKNGIYLFYLIADVRFDFAELNTIDKNDTINFAKPVNSINVCEDIIANGDNKHNFVKLLGNFAAMPANQGTDNDNGLFFYPILGEKYGIFGVERENNKILLHLIKLTED